MLQVLNSHPRFRASTMISSVLFLVALSTRSGLAFNSTCYGPPYDGGGPNGPHASGDSPCTQDSNDEEARACCGYSDGSICLSNGLCFVPANNTMMQGSCTDPTWTSPNCPNPENRCVGKCSVSCLYWPALTRTQTATFTFATPRPAMYPHLAMLVGCGIAVRKHSLVMKLEVNLLELSQDSSPTSETSPVFQPLEPSPRSPLPRPPLRNQPQRFQAYLLQQTLLQMRQLHRVHPTLRALLRLTLNTLFLVVISPL